MPNLALQLMFGSFGDIVTLIDLAVKLKDCLIDGVHMREEVQEFVQFLDRYVTTLHCIRSVLSSASAQQIPTSLKNAIGHALAESKRLVQVFFAQLDSFRPVKWWGSTASVLQAFRWALCSKKTLSELQEKLIAQGNSTTLLLSLSGLRITLDLASNTTYTRLPPQPQVYSIALIDFLDQRTDIPLEICLDRTFMRVYFKDRAGLSFIKRRDYDVSLRSDDGTSRTPWDATLQPGVTLSMSAILRSQDDNSQRCPRCNKMNSAHADNDGEVKCFYCQTFFRVAESRVIDMDNDEVSPIGAGAPDPSHKDQELHSVPEEDELQYIRRFLVQLHPMQTRQYPLLEHNPAQAPVEPGSVIYTTSTTPDGRVIYHPFKAVPASYQTPNGIVSGIQWVPVESTSEPLPLASSANSGFYASWQKTPRGFYEREQVDSYLFVDDPTRSRLGENLDGSSEILYRYDDDLYHSQESQAMQGHYSQEEPDDQLPAISIFDADFE
ncbi:unnamed protein product [Somion occarium]|uniref:Ubiquitin-like domain-containing protein n=1 Tax=Somion occarium TaxID=3059160 RepID=A0ABP1CU35_9APHY